MSGHLRAGSATRRRFLMTAASATATTALGTIALPSFSRSSQRPVITHGVQRAMSRLIREWCGRAQTAQHEC
jgi:hypothetical protein